MKELLQNFLDTYKLQKQHLDKNDNYTMDGKNFIYWYIKESGNIVNNINYTRCCESDSEQLPTGYNECNCSNAKDRLDCGFECYNK
jgi:hypothetical protein